MYMYNIIVIIICQFYDTPASVPGSISLYTMTRAIITYDRWACGGRGWERGYYSSTHVHCVISLCHVHYAMKCMYFDRTTDDHVYFRYMYMYTCTCTHVHVCAAYNATSITCTYAYIVHVRTYAYIVYVRTCMCTCTDEPVKFLSVLSSP